MPDPRSSPPADHAVVELGSNVYRAMLRRAERIRQRVPDGPLIWALDETLDLIARGPVSRA